MTKLLTCDAAGIAEAVRLIRTGGVVAVPTDTVYGLMADAGNADAVGKVFAAKQRDDGKKILVNVADVATAMRVVEMNPIASELAARHWPGGLTMELPLCAHHGLCARVRVGEETIGIRVPNHPVALAVLRAFGGPLTSTSANISGKATPPDAAGVLAALSGSIDAVLDGGVCAGVPSTVVRVVDGVVEMCRVGVVEL